MTPQLPENGDQPMASSPPAYLTPDEVATMLRVDLKTIYRWAVDRRVGLPVVRVRGVVRFNRVALEAWLDAGGQHARRRSRKLSPSSPKSASTQEPGRA